MTNVEHDRLRRVERVALGIGVVGGLGAIVLGWRSPEGVLVGWRLALFLCLQPAVGSLVFVLIFRLTGGQWMEGLAPFLIAGMRLLPWVWLLVIPLLFFPTAGKPEEGPRNDGAPASAKIRGIESPLADAPAALERAFAADPSHRLDPRLRAYFSRPVLIARAAAYAVAFFLLAAAGGRAMRTSAPAELRWVGPVGLIGLVFMLHLLAVDWFGLLEPGWHSTGFPLVWITAQALAGLALAIAAAVLAGAKADRRGSAGRSRGLDWGNLLLAAVMSWTYVGFVQWLIIWSGNVPAETAWYRHRSDGLWRGWLMAVAALVFAAPFLLLLSRGLKRRSVALAFVAAMIVAGQFAYTVWLIAPAFPTATRAAPFAVVAIATSIAALFLNRYLAAARRNAVAVTG